MIYEIGTILAITGSILSVLGALINNLRHDHRRAMEIWTYSNILLLVWAAGLSIGAWNGGLSGAALCVMYAVFMISNAWGLKKYAEE